MHMSEKASGPCKYDTNLKVSARYQVTVHVNDTVALSKPTVVILSIVIGPSNVSPPNSQFEILLVKIPSSESTRDTGNWQRLT